MQVTGLSLGETVGSLVKTEGIPAFWKGIAFAWGREASYASIKLGAYAPVREALGASGADAPFYLKFLAGALTGGVGSVIGNPFDVMKTLAQANKEKSLPLATLVGNMYRDQGMAGFYRGVQANIARACVLNATKMACYDISKGCTYFVFFVKAFDLVWGIRVAAAPLPLILYEISDRAYFIQLLLYIPKQTSAMLQDGDARMSVLSLPRVW